MAKRHAIRPGDIVNIVHGKHRGKRGSVQSVRGGEASVLVYLENGCKLRSLKIKELSLVPPLVLAEDELRGVARCEAAFWGVLEQYGQCRIATLAHYQMTLEDLRIALSHLVEMGDENKASAWYFLVFEDFYVNLGLWDCMFADPAPGQVPGMPDSCSVFEEVREKLIARFELAGEDVDLLTLVKMIESYQRDAGKPLQERELTLDQKRRFLRYWDNARVLVEGSPEIEALYTTVVEELAKLDDPEALRELAYACYGSGNAGFDEDWVRSRDCLLRLQEIAPYSHYANTLGYIYYYGRCNGGVRNTTRPSIGLASALRGECMSPATRLPT